MTDFQERMILDGNFADKKRSDRFDLFLGNGYARSVSANKADHTTCLEDANAVSGKIRYSHKCIPGKERQFDFCASIAPLPRCV